MAAHARAPLSARPGQAPGNPAKAVRQQQPRHHPVLPRPKSQAGIPSRGACARAASGGASGSSRGDSRAHGDVHNPVPTAPRDASVEKGVEEESTVKGLEGPPCFVESAAAAAEGEYEFLTRSGVFDGSAAVAAAADAASSSSPGTDIGRSSAAAAPGLPAEGAPPQGPRGRSEGAAQEAHRAAPEAASVSSAAEAETAARSGIPGSLGASASGASGGVYGHSHRQAGEGPLAAPPLHNHHNHLTAPQAPPTLAISATTVLLTLVLSTFTALGASMFAVIKIMQPALQNTEKAAKGMEEASLELKKAAIDMQKTADMFQKEIPEMSTSIQETSVEFEELGRTLNAVSGGWRGSTKRSKRGQVRKGEEQGGAADEAGRQQRSGEPSRSSSEGSSAAEGVSRVRPAGGWTSRTTAGVSIRNSRVRRVPLQAPSYKRLPPGAIGADEALLMEEQAALALFEDRVPPESGWYTGAVSGLWQFTKGIQDAISPRAKQVQTAVGGITDLFDNAKRAEAARLRRKDAARAWITDWRSRTGVEVKTELAPAAEGSDGPEGAAAAAAAAAPPTLAESAAALDSDAGPGPGSHPLLLDQAEQGAAMDQQQLIKVKQASASAVLDYSIDIPVDESGDWLDWDEAAAKDDEDADETWRRPWPRSGIPTIPHFEPNNGPANVLNTMAMMREIQEAAAEISERVITAQQEGSKELQRDAGALLPRSPRPDGVDAKERRQQQQQTKEPPDVNLKSVGAAWGSSRGPLSSSGYDSDDYDENLRDEDIRELSFYGNLYNKLDGSPKTKRNEGRLAAAEEQGGTAKGSSSSSAGSPEVRNADRPRSSTDGTSAGQRKPVRGGDEERAGAEDGEAGKGEDGGSQGGPMNRAIRADLGSPSRPAAQRPPSL